MRDLYRSQIDIIIALATTFGVVFVDRMTKSFFMQLLSFHESLPLIKNVLHMTLVYNTGIAFGFFKDKGVVFIVIPMIAIALLVYNIFYYKNSREGLSRGYVFAFSLILGGAIGNLIDRIQYGYVIDFIDFRFWPVFNVADSAITIGAVIVALKCLQTAKTNSGL